MTHLDSFLLTPAWITGSRAASFISGYINANHRWEKTTSFRNYSVCIKFELKVRLLSEIKLLTSDFLSNTLKKTPDLHHVILEHNTAAVGANMVSLVPKMNNPSLTFLNSTNQSSPPDSVSLSPSCSFYCALNILFQYLSLPLSLRFCVIFISPFLSF